MVILAALAGKTWYMSLFKNLEALFIQKGILINFLLVNNTEKLT